MKPSWTWLHLVVLLSSVLTRGSSERVPRPANSIMTSPANSIKDPAPSRSILTNLAQVKSFKTTTIPDQPRSSSTNPAQVRLFGSTITDLTTSEDHLMRSTTTDSPRDQDSTSISPETPFSTVPQNETRGQRSRPRRSPRAWTTLSPLHGQFLETAERDLVHPDHITQHPTTPRPPTSEAPGASYQSQMHKEFLMAAERHKVEMLVVDKGTPLEWFEVPNGDAFDCRIAMFRFIRKLCKIACRMRSHEDGAMKRGCEEKEPINSEHIRFLCCYGPKPKGVH